MYSEIPLWHFAGSPQAHVSVSNSGIACCNVKTLECSIW